MSGVIKDTQTEAIIEKIEGLVSFGTPTCDVCYHQDEDHQHPDAEFWPDEIVIYVNNGANALCEWKYTTICPHHDRPDDAPEDVTHRVIAESEYIGDEHQMNSAHEYTVTDVTEVKG